MMGLSVEVVRKPPKPIPEEVAEAWAREWAKEGKVVYWQRLLPPRGFKVLPRRWVVERTFSWLGQTDEQGLRASAGKLKGICLCGDDAPYAKEVSPCLRIFQTVSRASFANKSLGALCGRGGRMRTSRTTPIQGGCHHAPTTLPVRPLR
jgi:hypothetical protein